MGLRKRSKDERDRDRARIAELMMLGYNHDEITELLFQETGLQLSRRQITYDVGVIRDRWRETQITNYHQVVNEELSRVDALEKEIWKALRAGMSETKLRTISKIKELISELSDTEEDVERIVSRIRPFIEIYGVNPTFFAQILATQQERRRILGIYAPATVRGAVDVTHTVTVKGYKNISPDDWPDAVEGEFKELSVPKLTDGR